MKKVVIFDLYNTVLKDGFFSFEHAMVELHHAYFEERCTLEEFLEFEKTFFPVFLEKREKNIETCLIEDEIPFMFEKFGVSAPESWDELDYQIMNWMQKGGFLDEVQETLEDLRKMGVEMYILSNTVFTGKSTMRLLDDFGILHYFKKVYASADYQVRKPSKEFFEIAVSEILDNRKELSRKEILFVGNDYEADAKGAIEADLDVVWYNVEHAENVEKLEILEMDDFRKLIDIVK